MADFDEYRTKWIYDCPNCKAHVIAFRDCGKVSPCKCGSNLNLTEVAEPKKHVEYNGNYVTAVHTFKPYFDVTLAREVQSEREIKEYCARNDCVYAGDKELTQQCEQNKRRNEERRDKEFCNKLTESLMSL